MEAAELDTPDGAVWVARGLYADDFRHGRVHVAGARAWDAAGLARLAREPRVAGLPLESWAFVDIETTGLGTQAGIWAFLVGIGWMDAGGFRIEQILLRDPSEEPALLHTVSERLGAFAGIVTFNGKAFDLPVLQTRFALARRRTPQAGLVHCDVLHAGRRAWGHRFESCRLAALERRLLGVRRANDLDGRLVPQAFLDYLRRGEGAILDPVLARNRMDLLSLLLVAAEAARFFEHVRRGGFGVAARGAALAEDRLQAARLLRLEGDTTGAAELLELCLAGTAALPERAAARTLLASLRKREGDLENACRLWEEQLREDPTRVEAVEELAKVEEHRRRDPAAALARVEARLGLGALDAASEAALRHRRARLERKLGRGQGPFAPFWE
jgi:uncharacterized protein YprB with RNaseH-like and TPR domain